MRLRRRDLTTVYLKKKVATTDNEGYEIVGWSEPVEVKMNVQNAGGTVNAQVYGKNLQYVKSCKYQGDDIVENRDENVGVCLFADKDSEPDYKIISIQTYKTHKNIMLEKIIGNSND